MLLCYTSCGSYSVSLLISLHYQVSRFLWVCVFFFVFILLNVTLLYKLWFIQRFPLDFITLSAFSFVFFSFFFIPSKCYSVIQAVVRTAFPSWFHYIISLLVCIFFSFFFPSKCDCYTSCGSYSVSLLISLHYQPSRLYFFFFFFSLFFSKCYSVIQAMVHTAFSSWIHYIISLLVCIFVFF